MEDRVILGIAIFVIGVVFPLIAWGIAISVLDNKESRKEVK
jgi:hypothetical protein